MSNSKNASTGANVQPNTVSFTEDEITLTISRKYRRKGNVGKGATAKALYDKELDLALIPESKVGEIVGALFSRGYGNALRDSYADGNTYNTDAKKSHQVDLTHDKIQDGSWGVRESDPYAVELRAVLKAQPELINDEEISSHLAYDAGMKLIDQCHGAAVAKAVADLVETRVEAKTDRIDLSALVE